MTFAGVPKTHGCLSRPELGLSAQPTHTPCTKGGTAALPHTTLPWQRSQAVTVATRRAAVRELPSGNCPPTFLGLAAEPRTRTGRVEGVLGNTRTLAAGRHGLGRGVFSRPLAGRKMLWKHGSSSETQAQEKVAFCGEGRRPGEKSGRQVNGADERTPATQCQGGLWGRPHKQGSSSSITS